MIKISIITVTYNCINTIERTLKSVFSQTYSETEYIVIDGASTDGTIDLIRSYKDKIDILISEHDNGVYDAMNKALGYVTGDVVEFLNGDDYLYDDRVLERVAYEFENHSNTDILVGKEAKGIVSTIHYPDKYTNVYIDAIFPHQAIFAKKNLFEIIGKFDQQYKICADRDWLLHAWNDGYIFRLVDDIYVYFEEGGNSFGKDTPLEEYLVAKKYLINNKQEDLLPIAQKRCVNFFSGWYVEEVVKSKKYAGLQKDIWRTVLGKNAECIVWGQGKYGTIFIDSLINSGYIVSMVIDNSLKDSKRGLTVNKYSKELIDKPVIIATPAYEYEIIKDMECDGINEKFIISFDDIRNVVFSKLDNVEEIKKYFKRKTGLDLQY